MRATTCTCPAGWDAALLHGPARLCSTLLTPCKRPCTAPPRYGCAHRRSHCQHCLIATLQASLQQAKDSLAASERQLADAEARLQLAAGKLAASEAQLSEAAGKLAATERQLADANSRLGAADAEVAAAKQAAVADAEALRRAAEASWLARWLLGGRAGREGP